ncbi:hypothetical protein [Streptomyces sp. DH37]|uniref:hypothetical protein n=1 Tax=Streptomyces sp. DH37 TaxID=3040122 RepID=UPI002442C3BB|nr:hypothetical protein [Streptomyces sp. DH37]MDG9703734.1 hypothetical protein [Streptomyces sp. DH37]
MTLEEITEQRAERHCEHMPRKDQLAFLLAYARARDDVATGADVEGRWARMTNRFTAASTPVLAGYLEGLASTRVRERVPIPDGAW